MSQCIVQCQAEKMVEQCGCHDVHMKPVRIGNGKCFYCVIYILPIDDLSKTGSSLFQLIFQLVPKCVIFTENFSVHPK